MASNSSFTPPNPSRPSPPLRLPPWRRHLLPCCGRRASLSLRSCSPHTSTARVRVEMNRNRGKVTIEFAGLEDLERIYRLMIGEPSINA